MAAGTTNFFCCFNSLQRARLLYTKYIADLPPITWSVTCMNETLINKLAEPKLEMDEVNINNSVLNSSINLIKKIIEKVEKNGLDLNISRIEVDSEKISLNNCV